MSGNVLAAASDKTFVDEWAADYAFNPYRNYPLITAADATQVLADEAFDDGAGITRLWHRPDDLPAGLLRVVDLPWDTRLYGRRMGRITHICGDLDGEEIRRLLDTTSYDHLAARVDASDLGTQRALSRAGFFLADSLLTYLYDPSRGPLPGNAAASCNRDYHYRPYEASDRDSVLRITEHCYARFPGRYHTDPCLSDKGAERYVLWAEKCMDEYADQICIAESKGRVVGYIAFRYDRRLYRLLGIGCYGGAALGASRGGDYQSLLRYTLECPKIIPMHFAECQTQIDNYHVHRIYHDLGLRYVRAEHTYHLHRD